MPQSQDDPLEPPARPARRGVFGGVFGGALRRLARWLWGWTRWIGARLLALMSVLVFLFSFINPPTSWTILTGTYEYPGTPHEWTPIGDIAPAMVRAVVAAEDANFCSHWGFDMIEIRKVIASGSSRGASTLTQQTAKNVFLWQGGGYLRKGLEAWFTVLIESVWGKRRIMEVYLNVAETGIGTYGVEAGAQRYFKHSAAHLTRSEAARMAAALPLPKKRSVISPSGFTRRYGNTISARVRAVGRDGLDSCVYE